MLQHLLAFFALLVFTSAPLSAAEAELTVTRAAFGLFEVLPSNEMRFAESSRVPLIPGQQYGWLIAIKSNQAAVKWKEEFSLPTDPKTWGVDEPVGTRRISKDRKTSVTERTAQVVNGHIFNVWSVAEGDPRGPHSIRVYASGKLLATFNFEVR